MCDTKELPLPEQDDRYVEVNGRTIKLPYAEDFKPIEIDKEGNRIYSCPICSTGKVKIKESGFNGRCDNCRATVIDYKPLPHQEAFHQSNSRYRLNVGGFGSGKTTASVAELCEHVLERSNSVALITAISLKQVKDAVLPELDKFLPKWFIQKKTTAPTPYYKLTNGSVIMVYSSDRPDNLRSLNLTAFYIEEASGVPYAIFDQLMTRLRNSAGILKDEKGNEIGYRYMGILSTNPEDGWIKDKFLLKSGTLITSPSIDVNEYKKLMQKPLEKEFHSFISSTRDNVMLPSTFIEGMTAGKSEKWIRKYVDCYLDSKDGLVYPDYYKHVVEPFPIPKSWERIVGFDPGYNDPTAVPKGAIDPKDGVIYVYNDYSVPEQPISYHAKRLREDLFGLKLFMPIQADPSVAKRNDRDGISYSEYFLQQSGYYLEPANNDLLYGWKRYNCTRSRAC